MRSLLVAGLILLIAPRVRAQGFDSLSPALDLGGAISLVGEGAEHQPIDSLRLRLRVGSCPDSAG